MPYGPELQAATLVITIGLQQDVPFLEDRLKERGANYHKVRPPSSDVSIPVHVLSCTVKSVHCNLVKAPLRQQAAVLVGSMLSAKPARRRRSMCPHVASERELKLH